MERSPTTPALRPGRSRSAPESASPRCALFSRTCRNGSPSLSSSERRPRRTSSIVTRSPLSSRAVAASFTSSSAHARRSPSTPAPPTARPRPHRCDIYVCGPDGFSNRVLLRGPEARSAAATGSTTKRSPSRWKAAPARGHFTQKVSDETYPDRRRRHRGWTRRRADLPHEVGAPHPGPLPGLCHTAPPDPIRPPSGSPPARGSEWAGPPRRRPRRRRSPASARRRPPAATRWVAGRPSTTTTATCRFRSRSRARRSPRSGSPRSTTGGTFRSQAIDQAVDSAPRTTGPAGPERQYPRRLGGKLYECWFRAVAPGGARASSALMTPDRAVRDVQPHAHVIHHLEPSWAPS